MTDTDFDTPSEAPMAKMLSVILVFGQWFLAIGVVCSFFMALFMLIPSEFRTGLINDLPDTVRVSTFAGQCLVAVVSGTAWFIVLGLLRHVVNAVIHGDPFLFENVSRLRTIWILIAATEILRMLSTFVMGNTGDAESAKILGIRVGTWFLIFVIAAISEAFRHGAALRAEQELTI